MVLFCFFRCKKNFCLFQICSNWLDYKQSTGGFVDWWTRRDILWVFFPVIYKLFKFPRIFLFTICCWKNIIIHTSRAIYFRLINKYTYLLMVISRASCNLCFSLAISVIRWIFFLLKYVFYEKCVEIIISLFFFFLEIP